MKKIIFTVIVFFIMLCNISAETNTLEFTEKGNKLFYNTESYDDNTFMNHPDMIPGKEYKDELIIENKSDTKYRLYLKVNDIEENKELAELLKNIEMKVYLDDKLIYEGYADGLDYNEINLKDSVLIGDYSKGQKSKITVYTKLSEEYENTNQISGNIEWEFYANYGDDIFVINPDTKDNITTILTISSSVLILLFLIIILIVRKDTKKCS